MDTHEYSNGEITILWKPELCTHSGVILTMFALTGLDHKYALSNLQIRFFTIPFYPLISDFPLLGSFF